MGNLEPPVKCFVRLEGESATQRRVLAHQSVTTIRRPDTDVSINRQPWRVGCAVRGHDPTCPFQPSAASSSPSRCLGHTAVASGLAWAFDAASICASLCRMARTSRFSVTRLHIIHRRTPPAIGHHRHTSSSSHIGHLLRADPRVIPGHPGPDACTRVRCLLCLNASGAASGLTGGPSSTIASELQGAPAVPIGGSHAPGAQGMSR
jgi:hypothetical protein